MTATVAPSPWPSAGPSAAPRAWMFCHEVRIDGPAGARTLLRWVMKRNCSITPQQLLAVYACLCVVSLSISLFFLIQGAPFVMAFAGVELLLVGLALLVYARHAGDRETITLAGVDVAVEQQIGRRARHASFQAEWLAVEPVHGQGSLVMLSGQGQSMLVGRFLRPELRAAFAHELRRALRRAHAQAAETEQHPNRIESELSR
jgi:uncharacterized membrane protein